VILPLTHSNSISLLQEMGPKSLLYTIAGCPHESQRVGTFETIQMGAIKIFMGVGASGVRDNGEWAVWPLHQPAVAFELVEGKSGAKCWSICWPICSHGLHSSFLTLHGWSILLMHVSAYPMGCFTWSPLSGLYFIMKRPIISSPCMSNCLVPFAAPFDGHITRPHALHLPWPFDFTLHAWACHAHKPSIHLPLHE